MTNRSTERPAPLVAVRKRTWRIRLVVKPVVGVQVSAVPIPLRISMERVAARLGGKVHVDPGSAPVLTGVSVTHHAQCLNFVRAQHVVARAGIVQVAVWIVHVAAVDGEQVRGTRHAVGREVSVASARAQHDAGR